MTLPHTQLLVPADDVDDPELSIVIPAYVFGDAFIELNHQAIFGLFLLTASVLVYVAMLVIHAIGLYVPIQPRPAAAIR